ncbi:MAG: DUF4174 domain-containing protein [Thalassococcus sp.]|uniref:DUF4174 domain-containing protein n=1 Tax=Thalassococcus sp. TaxID=1928858 RepID=UPI001B279192|nr:DUF4174 domain-containing protein [Thalassococcus sp.]MBO6867308.1 DUF4174 domain-containing protein [Thalassococcus sp.]
MRRILASALAALMLSGPAAHAADGAAGVPILEAGNHELSEFLWLKRPIVVFADSPADPRYVEQINLLTERLDVLEERDVVILTDTDPAAQSTIRTELRPRGFMFVLIAKDGTKVLRKPFPWDVREITRSIDKLPLRQQEIRDQRNALP